jgi:hypothetical protein
MMCDPVAGYGRFIPAATAVSDINNVLTAMNHMRAGGGAPTRCVVAMPS